MKVANAVMAVLFALSAAVQHNDPDPLPWMAIYGASCVACVIRIPRWAVAGLGVVALTWAAVSAWNTHLSAPFGEALTDWEMHAGGSEELRETLGLVIVAGWMGVLGWRR